MRQFAACLVLLACGVIGQDRKPDTSNKDTNARFPWDDNKYDKSDRSNKNRPLTDQRTFYLDSPVDCSGNTAFTISANQKVTIKGRGSVQTGTPLLKCNLMIEIDTAREARRFHIGIRSLDIRDCDVTLNIFDGRIGQNTLESYMCKEQAGTVQKENVLYTSGNIVTFELMRKSRESSNYDIDVDLSPIRDGDTGPGCREGLRCTGSPMNHWKFEQKYLVLIVGLSYLLITVIIGTIITVCLVKNSKSGGHWERRTFGYNNPTLSNSGGTTASGKQVTGPHVTGSNNVWVTPKPYGKEQLPRTNPPMVTKRVPVVTKRFVAGNEDNDSVFESDSELISEQKRRREADLPRTSTHRSKPQPRRYSDDADEIEDEPRLSHVEREIAISDKPRKHQRQEEEMSFDESYSESEHSSDENDEEEERRDSGDETQHTDVEEPERGIGRSDGKRSGREGDAYDSGRRGGQNDGGKPRLKQNRGVPAASEGKNVDVQNVPPSYEESARLPAYDGEQRQHGPANDRRMEAEPVPQYDDRLEPNYGGRNGPYGDLAYRQPYEPRPPQYQPTNDPRPIQSYRASPGEMRRHPEPYNRSPLSSRREHPAPYYTNRPAPQPNSQPRYEDRYRGPDNPPAPSFSHIVRRGYMEDGRSPASSAASSHHSREQRLDDSVDYSANLDSGVELMRRTTEV